MGKEEKQTGQAGSVSPTTRTTANPYNQVAQLKNGVYQFNFQASLTWLEQQGKSMFGEHFAVFPEDHAIIFKLLVYAIGDRENTDRQNLDLRKGILLAGPIGVGKTALMTLTNYFSPVEKCYLIRSVREISFEFEQEGYKLINRYSKGSFRLVHGLSVPLVYCFDDLGVEQTIKYFGNECNVMAEILLSRYDLFVSKGMLTHVTTNLSASELEVMYGNRLRSRFREMFNLIAFDKTSRDKRR
jgi:hypothetical protein